MYEKYNAGCVFSSMRVQMRKAVYSAFPRLIRKRGLADLHVDCSFKRRTSCKFSKTGERVPGLWLIVFCLKKSTLANAVVT